MTGIEKLLNKKVTIEKFVQFEKTQEQKDKPRTKNAQNDKNVIHNPSHKETKGTAVDQHVEVIYFNGIHANRKNTPETKTINDPLFTQPYTSEESAEISEKGFDFSQKSQRYKQRKYPAKSVPALFVPPVNK